MMMCFRLRKLVFQAIIIYGAENFANAASPAAGLERFYIGTYAGAIYQSSLNLDTGTFGNVRSATSSGVETTLELHPRKDLEMRGSYTYNDTEDRSTGLQLARRPRHRWTLLTAFEPGGRLRGTATLTGETGRIDSDGNPMDSYTRVDLSLEYRTASWLVPYLVVQNLLDRHYEEVTGYTTPGFTALAGLRFNYR